MLPFSTTTVLYQQPEIGLAISPTKEEEDMAFPSFSNGKPIFDDHVDHRLQNTIDSASSVVLDDSYPIIYHYLTFDTPLPLPSTQSSTKSSAALPPPEPDLQKFQSPFEWPKGRKNIMIWLSCLATLTTAYSAGSYASGSAQMAAEWNVSEEIGRAHV